MRCVSLFLLALAACQDAGAQPKPHVDAGTVDLRWKPPFRGPRPVGCRERTMRLSISMCDWGTTVIPTKDATPDHLMVEAIARMTVDECLRAWEQLAKRCDGASP
jgi:hypothetical protein